MTYIQRSDWGAAAPSGPYSHHEPHDLVIHHSDTAQPDFRGADTIKAIQLYHMQTKGWIDIAYHFLIGPNGDVYEGRPLMVKGSHVEHGNTDRVGVCFIGDMEKENPTPSQLQAMLTLMADILAAAPTVQTVWGHRDLVPPGYTQCPGKNLYALVSMFKSHLEGLR